VRDNRQFGRKPLVGVHTVRSLESFRCDAPSTPHAEPSDQTVIDMLPDVADATAVDN